MAVRVGGLSLACRLGARSWRWRCTRARWLRLLRRWRARSPTRARSRSRSLRAVIVGYVLERPIEERLGGPLSLAAGLMGGGVALALADEARRPGKGDGLGTQRLAWSAVPGAGVDARGSRRMRSFSGSRRRRRWRPACRAPARRSPRLVRLGIRGRRRRGCRSASPARCWPGATALKAWRGRPWTHWRVPAAGAAAAFVAHAGRAARRRRRAARAVVAVRRRACAARRRHPRRARAKIKGPDPFRFVLGLRYRRAR